MEILSVDDEEPAREMIIREIKKAEPGSSVTGYRDPEEALQAVHSGKIHPDIAFLDIEMFGMTGIDLAKKLKDESPRTAIIFVTGYSQYALDAYAVHARGYLLKPVTAEQVRIEIDALKEMTTAEPTATHQLKVVCFGSFDAFVDGKQIKFPRTKSKELLAYLVHKKGSSVTVRDIAAALYEDKDFTSSLLSQVRTNIATLIKTLEDAGVTDVIVKRFNSIAINTDKIDCDLYKFLNGVPEAINSYFGEYMTEYEWAEFTVGYLDKQIEHKN